MKTTTHFFTFGTDHVCWYPVPLGTILADYWVAVELPEDFHMSHRSVFVEHFTKHFCPRPGQWAFEYYEGELNEAYFPGGELCRLNGMEVPKP